MTTLSYHSKTNHDKHYNVFNVFVDNCFVSIMGDANGLRTKAS